MEPTLYAGQLILVSFIPYIFNKPKIGDLVVAFDIKRNIKVIKRVKGVDKNMIYIVSDNIGHGNLRKIDKSKIIGKVVWF